MFVRWKKRLLHKEKGHHALSAVLVQSARVNGKPRQRIIRYLATVSEKDLRVTAHRESFWASVDQHLDDLAIDSALRQQVEEKLTAVVARPTPAELEQLERDRQALARWWRSAQANETISLS